MLISFLSSLWLEVRKIPTTAVVMQCFNWYCVVSHKSLVFSWYTPEPFIVQVGYCMAYHKGVLHNYFIPYYIKYYGQHHQCDICSEHDGKVWCNCGEYTIVFLLSDWLSFLWHDVNGIIYILSLRQDAIGDLSVRALDYQLSTLVLSPRCCSWNWK